MEGEGKPNCTKEVIITEIREPNPGNRLWLGTFNTSFEAALAYDEVVRKLYGPSVKLNLPQPYDDQYPSLTSLPENFVKSCKETSMVREPLKSLSIGGFSGSSIGSSFQSSQERLVRKINTEMFKFKGSSLGDDGEEVFYWPEFSLENDFLEMNDNDVLMGQEFKSNWEGNEIAGMQNQWFF
ncbi:hypothetical protein CRYUN_Cryun05aG0034100 [Craigia yunnanensis]